MPKIATTGLDLAKDVFQAHGADATGSAVLRNKPGRDQALAFSGQLRPSVVAMEACDRALPPKAGALEAGVFGYLSFAVQGSENDEGIEAHRGASGAYPEAEGRKARRLPRSAKKRGSGSRPILPGRRNMTGCCLTRYAD